MNRKVLSLLVVFAIINMSNARSGIDVSIFAGPLSVDTWRCLKN